jgi:UDP-glucose 4-epimerase
MVNALVLGANGKLGSHLSQSLATAGYNVRAFDRFSRPHAFEGTGEIEVFAGDLRDSDRVRAALEGQDMVFHALWSTTPATQDNDLQSDVELNLLPTVRMLEECVDAGVHKAYFMSSGGAVYDPTYPTPHAEGSPLKPLSPYGHVKVIAEGYFDYFEDRYGIDSTIFRIANLFGFPTPAPVKRGLISVVLRRIADGQAVTRYGDGSMERDYVHVSDAARMITQVALTTPEHDVYNLGTGTGHTVTDVLSIIRNVTGVDFEIDEIAVPLTFQQSAVLDVNRFDSEFGRPDFISLEDGIAAMWKQLQAA